MIIFLIKADGNVGKGWENHVEGQKLKADGDSFRLKLNTQEIFEDWARKVQQRNLGVSGRIFTIDTQRTRIGGRGNTLRLRVNFLPEIITLAKEVRNLKILNFRVPLAIVNKAHQANQLYPFAVSLIESIRTYERTLEKVNRPIPIPLLIISFVKNCRSSILVDIFKIYPIYFS